MRKEKRKRLLALFIISWEHSAREDLELSLDVHRRGREERVFNLRNIRGTQRSDKNMF